MQLRKHAFAYLLFMLPLGGCAGTSPPAPLVVGHVAVLSGAEKDGGEQAVRGIRLAVKEVNKNPPGGRTVAVLHTDTRGKPQAFEAEAVRLIAVNRALALLGGITAEEVERLDQDRVPVVTPLGWRTRAMTENVFCTGLAPAFQGEVLARFAAQQLAARLMPPDAAGALGALSVGPLAAGGAVHVRGTFPLVVVLVDERREEFALLAEAFARELPVAVAKEQATAAVSRPVPWRYGKDTNLAELVKHVQEQSPAAVLLAGEPAAVRELRVHWRDASVPVFFGGGEDSLKALQARRETSSGVYLVTAFVADNEAPRAREFIQQYREVFHEEPDATAALAYEGAGLLCEALRQADGFYSRMWLRDKLTGLQRYPGLFGPLTFGADHVLRRPVFVVQLDKGRPLTVQRFEPPP